MSVSFSTCTLPRTWKGATGLPCRGDEEESCNRVHATCAQVPSYGLVQDVSDPHVLKPKPACKPEEHNLAAISAAPFARALRDTAAARQDEEVSLGSLVVDSDVLGRGSCNARMLDVPRGRVSPSRSEPGPSIGVPAGAPTVAEEPMHTVWGTAVHGQAGTWAFESQGPHATDFVYQLPQGHGAPPDFYLCDSPTEPKHCALLGGNMKHACAEWYDPQQCNFCEDKGETLRCHVHGWSASTGQWTRVALRPEEVLGASFRDVKVQPLWASVELQKRGLEHAKTLPAHLVSEGPAQEVLASQGRPARPPMWLAAKLAGVRDFL